LKKSGFERVLPQRCVFSYQLTPVDRAGCPQSGRCCFFQVRSFRRISCFFLPCAGQGVLMASFSDTQAPRSLVMVVKRHNGSRPHLRQGPSKEVSARLGTRIKRSSGSALPHQQPLDAGCVAVRLQPEQIDAAADLTGLGALRLCPHGNCRPTKLQKLIAQCESPSHHYTDPGLGGCPGGPAWDCAKISRDTTACRCSSNAITAERRASHGGQFVESERTRRRAILLSVLKCGANAA
jgi:hypothetical protein